MMRKLGWSFFSGSCGTNRSKVLHPLCARLSMLSRLIAVEPFLYNAIPRCDRQLRVGTQRTVGLARLAGYHTTAGHVQHGEGPLWV